MLWLDAWIKRAMYLLRTSIKSKHVYAFLTCNSPTKFWNLMRVTLATRIGRTRDFGFPYILTVEPTNICNLRCPLCPTGRGLVGRPRRKLGIEQYRRIVDEIGRYVYLVNLQNWGEPLLVREIVDMIRYSREHRIFTTLSTNGNYAPRLNEELVEAGLDHITFAIDGSDQETYERYRVGGKLVRALDNMSRLLRARNSRGASRPFVELQFLVFDHNVHDVPNIRALARRIGVDGLLIRAANAPGNESNRRKFYTWNDRKGFCARFWYTATISSDGGLNPCCNYFDRSDDFGNVFDAGFAAAWNNEVYRRNRSRVAHGDVAALTEICRSCKVYDADQASYPIYRPIEESCPSTLAAERRRSAGN